MLNNKLVYSVISHNNRKYLLTALLNGTHTWLYDALSQITPNLDSATTRRLLRGALKEYLETLHRVHRRAGVTLQAYFKFYHENNQVTETAMIYLLKTLKPRCGDFYHAVLIALWVELEHKGDAYKEYVRECSGYEDDGTEVNPFLLYNYVCAAQAESENVGHGDAVASQ